VISPWQRFLTSRDIRWSRVALVVLAACGLGAVVGSALELRAIADPIRVLVASRFPGAGTPEPESAPALAPVTPSNATSDAGLVEVCGLGWVEKKADTDPIDSAVLAAIPGIEAATDALVERLRQSPDAFARAAGIVAAMAVASAAAGEALPDQLAQQATASADARLYALAFRSCGRTPAAGSCALLSAAQWARLDDGNGEPWLFVLDEAAARGDRAMVDEALYRVASAARFDDRSYAIAGPIAALAGSSAAEIMAAQVLAADAINRAAGLSPPWLRLIQACRGVALGDANRRQVCERIATTLAERADSTLVTMIGTGIGRQLGWPFERIVAVRALSVAAADSWSALPGAHPLSLGLSYGCDGARGLLAHLGRLAEVGELQAARDWMTASGKPVEYFLATASAAEARSSTAEAEDQARRSVAATASAAASARPGG
jgi:hypothetical protein